MRKYRKGLGLLLVLGLLVTSVYVSQAEPINTRRGRAGVGWILTASDDDLDTSPELVTELDTAYAQITAPDVIEVLSGSAADTTQTVTVSGIEDAKGRYITETFTLAGVAVQTSTTTFRYVNQIWLDKECAGVITIRKATGDALINSIDIGSLKGDVGQHFNGENNSYIQSWQATSNTTDIVTLELRWYPDDADCLDSGDGFYLLDRIIMAAGIYKSGPHPFGDIHDDGMRLPAGGWLAVFGTGGVANQEATVRVRGFDTRK